MTWSPTDLIIMWSCVQSTDVYFPHVLSYRNLFVHTLQSKMSPHRAVHAQKRLPETFDGNVNRQARSIFWAVTSQVKCLHRLSRGHVWKFGHDDETWPNQIEMLHVSRLLGAAVIFTTSYSNLCTTSSCFIMSPESEFTRSTLMSKKEAHLYHFINILQCNTISIHIQSH